LPCCRATSCNYGDCALQECHAKRVDGGDKYPRITTKITVKASLSRIRFEKLIRMFFDNDLPPLWNPVKKSLNYSSLIYELPSPWTCCGLWLLVQRKIDVRLFE